MTNFRDARRDEVPDIAALLADDVLGAGREVLGPDGRAAVLEEMRARSER
ncbi:MAG TPA: hypothetical protein VGM12_09330 [Trebonia sp.]